MIAEIIISVLSLVAYSYLLCRRRTRYWEERGVRVPSGGLFPVGNNAITCLDHVLRRKNLNDIGAEQYFELGGEKFFGTYAAPGWKPVLVIRDLKLVKDICIRDFGHFVDRHSALGIYGGDGPTETDRLWQNQLNSLKGDKWKRARSRVTPIFTPGKLKLLVPSIVGISERLGRHFEVAADSGSELELCGLFKKFSMDAMATNIFGVDAGELALRDDLLSGSEFAVNGRSCFEVNTRDRVRYVLGAIPGLGPLLHRLKFPLFKPKEGAYFSDLVQRVVAARRRRTAAGGDKRKDIINLLLEEEEEGKGGGGDSDLSLNFLAPTAVAMFAAGYETTGETLAHLFYELVRNAEIYDRLQCEVDLAHGETEGDLGAWTYEAYHGLRYLDMCVQETLRMHPPAAYVTRGCSRDYRLEGTDFVIKAGDEVHLPVLGIHTDPQFYPDPHVFDPENFSRESVAKRDPNTFLAFGLGPRNCPGSRLSLLEIKVATVTILRSFVLERCPRTPQKLSRDPSHILAHPREPIYVSVRQKF